MEASIAKPALLHAYHARLRPQIALIVRMDSTCSITPACPTVQLSLLLSLITRN